MTISMTYAACLLGMMSGLCVFTIFCSNFAGAAGAFIPSGGRVGAARLIRHMALNRV